MNIPLCRHALLALAGCVGGAATAAPQVVPLGEPDKHGAIVYSVSCDDGARNIVQCVRDDAHCGYAGDQPLAALLDQACGAKAPAAAAPADGESTPFQTAPAMP